MSNYPNTDQLLTNPPRTQVWKIKKFQGATELTLSAEIELVSTTTERKAW